MNSDALDSGVKRQALGDLTNTHGKRALPSSSRKTTTENKLRKFSRTFENDPNKKLGPSCLGSDISDGVIESKNLSCRRWLLEEGNLEVVNPEGTEMSRSRCLYPAFSSGEQTQEDDSDEETKEVIREGSDTDSTELMVHSSQTGGTCSCPFAFSEGNANSSSAKENDCDGKKELARSSQNDYCSVSCSKAGGTSFNMAGLEGLQNPYGASNKVPDAGVGDNIGMEKGCSCSFCLKAAYIWTDLHYLDARGRLAALKKSKTFARTVEGRCYNNEYNKRLARDNSTVTSKMEFDLMQHWRSLFLRTEDFLLREGDQLLSNLCTLKELRESCKRNLEKVNVASKKRS